jgi:hypothetical protein
MNITFDHLFKDFFIVESNGEEIPLPMDNMDELISRIKLYENTTNRRLVVYKSTTQIQYASIALRDRSRYNQ